MATTTPLDAPQVRPHGERPVYTWAALAALLVVFAGFARTYYLKSAFGTPDLSALKHLHGVVMTAWFALFFVQVRLVATGRTPIHRKLGVVGVGLAILVVFVGVTLGIASARSGVAPIGLSPLVFLVFPIGEMVAFVTLLTAAIVLRKRAAYHKRLMVLASIAMLTPAMARLPFDFVTTGGPLVFFALTDLVIIACIAFDAVKNRRLHPAFAAGLAFIVFVQIGAPRAFADVRVDELREVACGGLMEQYIPPHGSRINSGRTSHENLPHRNRRRLPEMRVVQGLSGQGNARRL